MPENCMRSDIDLGRRVSVAVAGECGIHSRNVWMWAIVVIFIGADVASSSHQIAFLSMSSHRRFADLIFHENNPFVKQREITKKKCYFIRWSGFSALSVSAHCASANERLGMALRIIVTTFFFCYYFSVSPFKHSTIATLSRISPLGRRRCHSPPSPLQLRPMCLFVIRVSLSPWDHLVHRFPFCYFGICILTLLVGFLRTQNHNRIMFYASPIMFSQMCIVPILTRTV